MMALKKILKLVHGLLQPLQLTGSYLWPRLKGKKKQTPIDNWDTTSAAITLQYPHEHLPVPPRGRYQLHNAIEDCIVCDRCAKVCPVDCIDIEGIPAPTSFGTTSQGKKKRIHAAKFDIDLSQCLFCGLCTTVCPTDCLTMTPEYDFSVVDIAEHTLHFSKMSEAEIANKKHLWDEHQHPKPDQASVPANLEPL